MLAALLGRRRSKVVDDENAHCRGQAGRMKIGDLGGYAAWKRALRAVAERQGTVPKSGAAVH